MVCCTAPGELIESRVLTPSVETLFGGAVRDFVSLDLRERAAGGFREFLCLRPVKSPRSGGCRSTFALAL